MIQLLIYFYGLMICASLAMAREVEYMINDDIKNQVSNSPWRVLPKGENYALAADLHAFWNVNNNGDDYYHSGYWFNSFFEYQPEAQITLNLKLSIFNPSNSYGYNAPARIVPFLAATWSPPPFLEMQFALKGGDLGRVTIGAGLLVEEKEMSGLSSVLKSENFSFEVLKPGTSVYEVSGDADLVRLSALDGLLGLNYFHTYAKCSKNSNPISCPVSDFDGSTYWKWKTQFTTIHSNYIFANGFGYNAEVARRDRVTARMANLNYTIKHSNIAGQLQIGGRAHDFKFWKPFVRKIDQDYISFEDRQKPYLNSLTILSLGNPKSSKDVSISGEVFKSEPIRVTLRNEFGQFRFYDREPLNYFMYDNGIAIYPTSNPSANGKFTYSNIVVNSTLGADVQTLGARPILRNQKHLRVEAKVEF